jgi:NAD(P)H-nitrite reductase large subunit
MSERCYICRCEEVERNEVTAAIAAGASTANDVKRHTKAGMGLCQGVYCVPEIAAMLSRALDLPPAAIPPITARPPVRPIALAEMRELAEE